MLFFHQLFFRASELLRHVTSFGFFGVRMFLMAAKKNSRGEIIRVPHRDIYLRLRTTDLRIYHEVFRKKEYDFKLTSNPSVIFDIGANIGMASIFFAKKYPNSKIYSFEPEATNFEMLKLNVSNLSNVQIFNCAIWSHTQMIPLFDNGSGHWGFMTSVDATTPGTKVIQTVEGISIEDFLVENNIAQVDLLKVDVEGAEKDIFSNAASWIDKISSICVELHEEMVPGVTQLVLDSLADFEIEHRDRTYFATRV